MKRNTKTTHPEKAWFRTKPTGQIRHKHLLAQKGWSYRAACRELGYTLTHLDSVLNGRRESRRLLAAIEALPDRKGAVEV
jgi:hypothetical protein